MEYVNDVESKRVKFVFVVWIGENVKVMKKVRVSIEVGDVKKVLSYYSVELMVNDKGDLNEDEVVKRLWKVGGVDYNGGRG